MQITQPVTSRFTLPAMNPKVILALLAVYIIWGSTYLVIRVVVKEFPPFLMAGARFIIAGSLLYGAMWLRGMPHPTRKEWRNAAIIGSLLMVCGNGGVTFAEQWVASSVAAIAVATMPLWTAIFASIWGRYPSRNEWVGIGLGMAGIVLLNLGGDLWVNTTGAIVLIFAPMCWALGSVWSHHLTMPAGLMSSAAQMLTGGVMLTVLGALTGESITETPSLNGLLAILYLIIFGSIVAFSAYLFLLKEVQPVVATSYAYVNPVIAVFLGFLLADEQLTPQTLLGATIILGAVFVITTQRASQKPSSTEHKS